MVIKPEIIRRRLKELDAILEELACYNDKTVAELGGSLSLRWIVERELIAACNIIFDIADHILSGYFGIYTETYEDSLRLLREKNAISSELYHRLKGLGGFRNILVHGYLEVDMAQLHKNFIRSLEIFPAYSWEIQQWLKKIE